MFNESKKRLADHYVGDVGTSTDVRNAALVALVVSKIKGQTVLDIGCGSGYLLGEISKHGKKAFSVEPNPELAQLLRSRYPAIPVAEKTMETLSQLSFENPMTRQKTDTFNTITILDVLEHIEDDRAALETMHRKLTPDGQLIVVVPAHRALYGKRDQAMGHYRRYSRKELVTKIKNAGFVVHEVRSWNALAFLPYWFYEKILHRELTVSYRTKESARGAKKILRNTVSWWLAFVERNISFGFGLSLLVVATKTRGSENLKEF